MLSLVAVLGLLLLLCRVGGLLQQQQHVFWAGAHSYAASTTDSGSAVGLTSGTPLQIVQMQVQSEFTRERAMVLALPAAVGTTVAEITQRVAACVAEATGRSCDPSDLILQAKPSRISLRWLSISKDCDVPLWHSAPLRRVRRRIRLERSSRRSSNEAHEVERTGEAAREAAAVGEENEQAEESEEDLDDEGTTFSPRLQCARVDSASEDSSSSSDSVEDGLLPAPATWPEAALAAARPLKIWSAL